MLLAPLPGRGPVVDQQPDATGHLPVHGAIQVVKAFNPVYTQTAVT